jgi:hypothetical protein
LLDVVDHQHPARHGLLAQLVQCLELEMAKLLMLVPCFIISTRGEAKWPSHLELEHVESVRAATDLDEKPTTPIPNPEWENPLVDLHLRPALVQLSEAHDGVVQRWDVVDAMQHAVLTNLACEHNRADTLNLHP